MNQDADNPRVDGSLESGGDDASGAGGGADGVPDLPNPETGVGIGAGEPSSFEPEEDPDAVSPPA